jgi:hypothetical protein
VGKIKLFLFIAWMISLGLIAMSSEAIEGTPHSYKPKDGFVPDTVTAIWIAEAVLSSIYGEEKIKSERPFKATLKNDVWTVEGSLPEGWRGGVAIVEISKQDGRILRVSHGK